MKRLAFVLLIVMIASLVVGPSALAGGGNGAPSGTHYNLNIIGVDNPKNADMTDSSRHTIFVPLSDKCNILLTEGDFQVLDGNCFSGEVIPKGGKVPGYDMMASFQLPDPEAQTVGQEGYGVLDYTAWVRVPGNRTGSARMATCIYDPSDTTGAWCSTGLEISRLNQSKFTNVSKDLLTVCAYQESTGTYAYEALFSDADSTYWWQYTNDGLKIAQLRFYLGVPDTGSYLNPCSH